MKVILFVVAISFILIPAGRAEVWEDLTSNLNDLDLNSVAVNPQNSDIVYCGSSKAVYKSSDRGESWKQVLGIRGEAARVNFISLHPRDPHLIFAATENGLFKSNNAGANWRKIFSGIGDSERNVLSLALHPQNYQEIYIGTQGGLFWSVDGGDSWNKGKGVLAENVVTFVAISPADYNLVYLATTSGVFKGNRKTGWQRVFVTSSELDESSNDEETF